MAPGGGWNQDSRQGFIQASLSLGITPNWEEKERRLKKKREKGEVLC